MKLPDGVTFRLVPRAELLSGEKARMFSVLVEHFDGVTPEQFARDLAEKDLAVLLERGGELVGFSTLMGYTTNFEGRDVNVIYSGDTIVTPAAWGSTALPQAWVAGVEALRAKLPPLKCYWLLLTSGFRTYRFLPVFWREFFPRFDRPTPPGIQRLMEQLARERFGGQFDSEAGIVRFKVPQRLHAELKAIPAGREHDPQISFFVSRNPGHASGDELVCLTEICSENLTAAGRRMMAPQNYAVQSDAR
jgi:hypothetical protein